MEACKGPEHSSQHLPRTSQCGQPVSRHSGHLSPPSIVHILLEETPLLPEPAWESEEQGGGGAESGLMFSIVITLAAHWGTFRAGAATFPTVDARLLCQRIGEGAKRRIAARAGH